MAYILHIDTSADTSTVMISVDGRPRSHRTNVTPRDHASAINNMITDTITDAGISMSQVSAVAVCSGPGSYTGLRIAMATAKGICYALDIPLLLHDRLSLINLFAIKQQQEPHASHFASILIARDKEYFISIHSGEFASILAPTHMMEAEMMLVLQGLEKLHITTNVPEAEFFKLKVNFLSLSNNVILDFATWAEYAYEHRDREGSVNIANAVPLYLKHVYTHK